MRCQLLKQKSFNFTQQILLKAIGYRNSLEFIHLLKIYQIVDSLGQIPSVRLSEGLCININRVYGQYCSEKVSPNYRGFEYNAIKMPPCTDEEIGQKMLHLVIYIALKIQFIRKSYTFIAMKMLILWRNSPHLYIISLLF